jgi:hypothetical protein
MMADQECLVVSVVTGGGKREILLTSEGIWIPTGPDAAGEDAPSLTRMMLGSTLVGGRGQKTEIGEADLGAILREDLRPREMKRRLESIATQVPYSMVVRCYLARPGRLKRPKLAFESFERRATVIVSREFIVDPGCMEALEEMLSSLIPDRLEVH